MKANFRIKVLAAEKRSEEDSYERGCIGDEKRKDVRNGIHSTYSSIEEVFRDIVGDETIKASDIRTFDPNIFCDRKDGGVRVVENNTARGHYRCIYDRAENSRGRIPSTQEDADFKAGKINLRLADYEVYFQIVSVGLDEAALAEFLGCSSPD